MDAFSKKTFLLADPQKRMKLTSSLSQVLTEGINEEKDFHEQIIELVSVLRSQGHDLWSIDESEDFEVWGPNYVEPSGPGLVITFTRPNEVDVEWSEE